MKEGKPFRYTVPASGLRVEKKIVVNAWRTECPGLIIQEEPIEGMGLILTHEASGFIVRSYEERERYEQMCRDFAAFGKVDWTVKTGKEIMEQCARLSASDAIRFTKILQNKKLVRPEEFTAAAAERAKNWDKFTAEQRAKV